MNSSYSRAHRSRSTARCGSACALAVAACLLVACGGGSSSGGSVAVAVRPPAQGLLKRVETEDELAQSLRSGLAGAAYVSAGEEVFALEDLQAASAEGGDGGAPGAQRFSGTNLQEAGVDEADIVKYDGNILYAVDFEDPGVVYLDADAQAGGAGITAPQPPGIRLYRTDPEAPSARVVAEVKMPSPEFAVDGLYLYGDGDAKQMLAVARSQFYFLWQTFASDFYWREGRTRVQSWGVGDPEQPVVAWSLEIDGSLLATRRVENMLYLVTRYSPALDQLLPYPQTEQEVAANKAVIESAPLASLLPDMRVDDGPPRELLAATDCYIPNADYSGLTVPPAGGSLVVVTAIDLEAPGNVDATCLNTFSSGFYASTGALYVTANGSDNSTLVHKVALSESGPHYRGSGEVPGYIGTSGPAFLMSEHNGDLRVVSSSWEGRFFPLPVIEPEEEPTDDGSALEDDGFGRHRLTVLRENAGGTQLETLASLPNAQRPEPIGKPDEDIYSARFIGDRAYVVTFRVIDPLYVLDLSDPEDPVITGELELPGFSTLLQPLGGNLLLGVGHEVDAAAPGLLQGVKLALFDVGDPAAPISLDQRIIGKRGSYSPALYNHHSLTLLQTGEGFRVALPVERYAEPVEQGVEPDDLFYYYGWSDSGLHLFDIDPVAGSISEAGRLIVEKRTQEWPYGRIGIYNSRSVLHDEAVFFVNHGETWPHRWGESGDYTGVPALQQ